MSSAAPDEALTTALVAELAKKTGVCWLAYDRWNRRETEHVPHAAWHVWFEDEEGGALYVVHEGNEQPLPGLRDAERVEVVMRSKDNGGRLVTWVATPSAVLPDDPRWEPVTAALVGGRLNLPDLATAVAEWERSSLVTRLAPTGEVVESPGALPDDAHLAEPRPTAATTRGPLPRVLHRRVRRRPRLS